MKRILFAIILTTMSFFFMLNAQNTDSHIYVATNGSDANPGTLVEPFATIHYQDEEVILSGTLPITSNWTQHSGNIYKTTLSEDIWQLFVDGKHMTLARFPNALAFSDLMWDRHMARRMKDPDQSSNGHVVDDPTQGATATLAGARVSFDGCVGVFNFGNFSSSAGIISKHTAGSDNFDFSPPTVTYKRNSSPYFIEGGVNGAELAMLDMAEEWAYDESTKTLYLWADDGLDPTGRTIEGKNQTYFFTGNPATKYITIDGLDFFGTAFYFYSSDYITIKNCDLNYYSYSKRALGSSSHSDPAYFEGTEDDYCSQITVHNCEFNYSTGTGLRGEKVDIGIVTNNLFTQNSYACASDGKPSPAAVMLMRSHDILFRRNTINTSGSAQAVKLGKRDNRPWISEYNYFTACGLQQTDGAAQYSFEGGATESISRYNWFYGNSERDFRWDGPNDPLRGVHANAYRNVAMDIGLKEREINGDGYRLKGDFHEIYNNIGIGKKSTINVALDKGGNPNSITRNNAADNFTDDPIPGIASHNFIGQNEPKTMKDLLRDPDNWDFRPRADAVELIDQGTNVSCTVNGQTIDVTAGYNGAAPDIGAYEYGDTEYWIPGRKLPQASMPVPPAGNQNVKLDADLMWLGALGATSYEVYFGTDPQNLVYQGSQTNNIFDPGELNANTMYYWRVDAITKGDVWQFTTGGINSNQKIQNVQIRAAESTDYGIGVIATMISDTITAPDGKATYQVSIDVNAIDGTSIFSRGENNGSIDWGVKSADLVNIDNKTSLYYKVNTGEKTGDINNIQIINFNAGGGSLTAADISELSFYSFIINYYTNVEDLLLLSIGSETYEINNGETTPNPEVIFSDYSGTEPVTGFSIACNSENSKNAWSIRGINVIVIWDASTSINESYLTERLGIAPNPVDNQFSIAVKPISTEIYSFSGKLMKQFPKGVSNFDVSSLNPGVYIVKVKKKRGNIIIEKIVKY
ncbi:MAG: T9SS type A sorting domain-containing protein [Deltaproteobacteria bacterium]|nr:T9SS type A sorting domain-containing protein [Deltaproteobacteria bacterium]